ncbi:MAG: hypothetical protein WCA77_04955 [Thermoplasmata archaeon]
MAGIAVVALAAALAYIARGVPYSEAFFATIAIVVAVGVTAFTIYDRLLPRAATRAPEAPPVHFLLAQAFTSGTLGRERIISTIEMLEVNQIPGARRLHPDEIRRLSHAAEPEFRAWVRDRLRQLDDTP